MKFNVLIALIGVSAAVKINQKTPANTATSTTGGPAQAGTASDDICQYPAPAAGPPLSMDCGKNETIDWIVGFEEDSCIWACRPMSTHPPAATSSISPPAAAPPAVPSRADQIQEFANGFFEHCDTTHGQKYLTKDEIQTCVSKMISGEEDSLEKTIET